MPTVQTELVARGVTFTNAIIPTPICEPSRVSFLTGLFADRHGFWTEGGGKRFEGLDQQTYAVWLHDAGYTTAYIGEYLNGYHRSGPPYRPTWHIPPGWQRWSVYADAALHYFGYNLVGEAGQVTAHGTAPADYATDVFRDQVLAFLQTAPSPWLAVFAPYAPHLDTGSPEFLPVPAPRHAGMLATLPPYRPPNYNELDVSDKPAWVQTVWPLMTPEEQAYVDRHRQAQHESLLAVDEAVAAFIAALKARGQYAHTVIIYTSDNGYALAEHRRWIAKGSAFEEETHVPMVVFKKGLVPRVESGLVANVDLAPSLAAIAGVTVTGLDGQDMSGVVTGDPDPRRMVPLAGRPGGGIPDYTGLRTGSTRETTYSTGEQERYNLLVDPWELDSAPY